MSEVDAGFLEVLASCAGAEGEVDYTDDGWKPPDGTYTVLLEKFTSGVVEKNGIQNGTAKAIFRIMTGNLEGKSFGEFYWLPSDSKKTTMGMSNLLRLGTCLSGRDLKVAEINEASEQAHAAEGSTLINVRVFSTTSKANGKVYQNVRFNGLVAEE